ncbi:DUF397 domain-containing protein [Kitasatospora sp. NPDC057904]|uniref:DUF397 domain-containing protein n=1 Tax=unclassified Kitasatospora TaxID=2633591 RepID=UPI0036DE17C6
MPTPDLTGASWQKSSYSNNGGNCVEVALGFRADTPVRDSKDPHGPALIFPSDAWRSFVSAIRAGEFGGI